MQSIIRQIWRLISPLTVKNKFEIGFAEFEPKEKDSSKDKLNSEKPSLGEFDKKFGFILKYEIDTKESYNKVKNYYPSNSSQ